jgi:hypothetical protein
LHFVLILWSTREYHETLLQNNHKENSMKKIILAAALAAASFTSFAANVGVAVSVGQPGFFGTIEIGNAPPPQVIYAQPRIIASPPPGVMLPPAIYLHVPLEHSRHWRRYCNLYNACGMPVFFVQDAWYNNVYVPHYRDHRDFYEGHRDGGRRDEGRRDEGRRDEGHRDEGRGR